MVCGFLAQKTIFYRALGVSLSQRDTYIHMHTLIHTHICRYVYKLYTYSYAYTHIYIYCIERYICIHIYAYVSTHADVHVHIHTYTEGPNTAHVRPLVPKTLPGIVFGTTVLKRAVYGPSGIYIYIYITELPEAFLSFG